jgi:hypothetical protein
MAGSTCDQSSAAATIQAWMGHEELATTNIYLTKMRNTSAETKAKVDSSFRRKKPTSAVEKESRVVERPAPVHHAKRGGAVVLESSFVL